MKPVTDPGVLGSFQARSAGFVARNPGSPISCPPYVIASIASDCRIDPGDLRLPDGYTNNTLDLIKYQAGWVDQEMFVSARQARELAKIGRQILDLDENAEVHPRLTYFEEQSIRHLVALVATLDE